MTEDTPLSGPDPESPPPSGGASVAMEFLSLGLGSALCLAVGAGIGLAVDAAAGTSPVFTLVGSGLRGGSRRPVHSGQGAPEPVATPAAATPAGGRR